MKNLKTALLASAIAIAPMYVSTPASAEHHEAGEKAEKAELTEGEKMKALFAQSDEDSLKRNPIGALFRGDERYADQLGDFISD